MQVIVAFTVHLVCIIAKLCSIADVVVFVLAESFSNPLAPSGAELNNDRYCF